MGKTYDIGISPNQIWAMGTMLGNRFEDWIFRILSEELQSYPFKTSIEQTKRSGDGGKDIIINSKHNIDGLLGQNFYLSGKKEITIYIECKSTESKTVPYNNISTNINESKYDNTDYYVLVTNSTIIPTTYYKIQRELGDKIKFVLVDQYLLANHLKNLNFVKQKDFELWKSIPVSNRIPDNHLQYQISQFTKKDGTIFELYMLFRNYTAIRQRSVVKMLTDVDWFVDDNDFSFILEPNGAYVKKICATRLMADGIEHLHFNIKTGTKESVQVIPVNINNLVFYPDFIGDNHMKIRDDLYNKIKLCSELQIFCLWGEAGVGKTRTIEELQKLLSGQIFDTYTFFYTQKKKDPTKDIFKYLLDNDYFKDKSSINPTSDISDLIKSMKRDTYHKAVIILDDFHNADPDFMEKLKKLPGLPVPLTFILCGRSDYSEGSIKYFSFVEWTKDNWNDKAISIKPLSDLETEKMICSIIPEIPAFVLDSIKKMSMNNPLFIIQFIEYLLDVKIVKLINRNSVGILNVESFSSKDFIPQKVSEIYKKRILNLLDLDDGDNYLNILMLLAFFGGSIQSEILEEYLKSLKVTIDILIQRRFIDEINGDTYVFIHESLYLYCKKKLYNDGTLKKELAKNVTLKFSIFQGELTEYEKGRLFLWNSNYKKAASCFLPIKNQLEKVNNISNNNVSAELYDYLYDVYDTFKKLKEEIVVLQNSLLIRIYMSLHYFAPAKAVTDSNHCLELLKTSPILKDDKKFKNTILSLKAHSLINSSQLPEGEKVLNELLSDWLLHEDLYDNKTIFDILDRLCSIYIKYNCFQTAINYNDLEFNVANQFNDESLLLMAHRTKSKLFFYNNPSESLKSLDYVQKYYLTDENNRISINNKLSAIYYNMMHDINCDWEIMQTQVEEIRKLSREYSYNSVLIRSYLVLAVCGLKMATDTSELEGTKLLIKQGINNSIRFGIPNYIWQFYNLLAIIDTRLNFSPDHIEKLFTTVYLLLKRQNLLYIGQRDFCYCNILAISNIGFFWQREKYESAFNEFMAGITYNGYIQNCNYNCADSQCNYTCPNNKEYLKKQYNRARNKEVLFVDNPSTELLRDETTDYFIAIS